MPGREKEKLTVAKVMRLAISSLLIGGVLALGFLICLLVYTVYLAETNSVSIWQ